MSAVVGRGDDIRSPSSSHGNSKIVHPDGNVIKEAGYFGDDIIVETIDISQATGSQAKRTYDEDTILREWFRQGCKFVVKV